MRASVSVGSAGGKRHDDGDRTRRIGLRHARSRDAARPRRRAPYSDSQLHAFSSVPCSAFCENDDTRRDRRERSALLSHRCERPALAGTSATTHRCRVAGAGNARMRDIRMRSTAIACAAGGSGARRIVRACAARRSLHPSAGNIAVETVASGLDHPWALAFLPDGRMLVTERPGRMRIVAERRQALAAARRRAEGLRVGPGRPARRRARPRLRAEPARSISATPSRSSGGARTALARARLVDEAHAAARRRRGDLPPGRAAVERQSFRLPHRADARRQSVPHHGRSLQPPRRGAEPRQPSRQDHPHPAGRLGAAGQSVRRPQRAPSRRSGATATATRRALALNPATGKLWEHEHGPRGGDEINIIAKPARTTAGR